MRWDNAFAMLYLQNKCKLCLYIHFPLTWDRISFSSWLKPPHAFSHLYLEFTLTQWRYFSFIFGAAGAILQYGDWHLFKTLKLASFKSRAITAILQDGNLRIHSAANRPRHNHHRCTGEGPNATNSRLLARGFCPSC